MSKIRLRLAAVATAAALSVAVSACGSSAPKAAATEHTQSTIAAATSQPAAPADQTDPNGQQCPTLDNLGYCPGDDPATPMDNWCNGNGYSDYQNVESDMSQLQSDAGNNDLMSVMSDGSSLFHDASVAGLNLPPGSKHQKLYYGLYMGWLMVAGEKASTGDISGASNAFQSAMPYKNEVMNLTNQCG